MKIAILNGSPRAKSNSVALAAAFAEGAKSAGHEVETVNVAFRGTSSLRAIKRRASSI